MKFPFFFNCSEILNFLCIVSTLVVFKYYNTTNIYIYIYIVYVIITYITLYNIYIYIYIYINIYIYIYNLNIYNMLVI